MTASNEHSAPTRRSIIKGALAAGVAGPAILRASSALAAYPDRPVKIIVANTPGGPSDIVGRITAAALQQSTGKTFIIENIGGAGGNIGFSNAARSEPDGYTILLATNALSVNVSLYNKIPFDPLKDFVGISELATSPNTFVVKSDLPAKTMKEFVALARANPEKFNCATPPIGTTPQIQLEVLKLQEKLPKLEDVVFKGGGDAIQALLSGTAQLSSGSLPPAAPHIKAGTLRCLAVTGETRWPDMPVCDRHRAAGAGQNADRDRKVAGERNAQGPCHRRDEGKALQVGLPGAAEGRRCSLGAGDQGNHLVPGHHRPGRHQKTVATMVIPGCEPLRASSTRYGARTRNPAASSVRVSGFRIA